MNRSVLTTDQLIEARAALDPAWVISPTALERAIEFPAFRTAVAFIDELAEVAERMDHHPDLTLSWRTVGISLSTHSAGGVTAMDVSMATELDPIISRLAARPVDG